MPYGGVKESDLGREGVRFAMEELTELRLLVVRTPKGMTIVPFSPCQGSHSRLEFLEA